MPVSAASETLPRLAAVRMWVEFDPGVSIEHHDRPLGVGISRPVLARNSGAAEVATGLHLPADAKSRSPVHRGSQRGPEFRAVDPGIPPATRFRGWRPDPTNARCAARGRTCTRRWERAAVCFGDLPCRRTEREVPAQLYARVSPRIAGVRRRDALASLGIDIREAVRWPTRLSAGV